MQDGHKKTDDNNTWCNLKVIAYEELPLDQADKVPRPISMPVPQAPVLSTIAVRTGNTIPAPWGIQTPVRPAEERRDTHPYSPFSDSAGRSPKSHSSSPAISGIRMQTLTPAERAEIEETNRNAAMISESMRASLQPGRLPDLTEIFADDEEVTGLVEESPIFAETSGPAKEILAGVIVETGSPQNAKQERASLPTPEEEDVLIEEKAETRSPTPSPEPVKKSLWGRMKGRVRDTLAAASGAISAFVRRHKSGVALAVATSLAAATGASVLCQQNQQQDEQSVAHSHQTASTGDANLDSMATDAAEKTARHDAEPKSVSNDAPTETPEQLPKTRTFVKNLKESKSPLVQDILNKGETTLQGSILSNTMLIPFVGLANNAQKAELSKLQRSINLGMGVFFNEHFGTAAKTAESLKDPNLRPLHSTAKAMKEKGWMPTSLTKEKYPEEYRLATQIFLDSHDLGLDQTSNPDPKAQQRVNGNMFQAKQNGDKLKLRKKNGQYHIVLEAVFGIFDGNSWKEALQTVSSNNETPGSATTKPLTSPKTAPTSTFLQNSIGGGNSGTHGVTTREPGEIFFQRPDTSEIDAEWGEISRQQDALKVERKILEKDQVIELTMPAGLKSSELHGMLPAAVGEKLATLYPQANREKVIGIIKRYGFIGFRLIHVDRETGYCRVQFFKNSFRIIKEILDKKTVRKTEKLS